MMSGDILDDQEAAYIGKLETDVAALRKAIKDIAAETTTDAPDSLADIQGMCHRVLKSTKEPKS